MADREAFLELAEIASEAIEVAGSLQKSAALGTEELGKISEVLTGCGLLKESEQEAFIKTASNNPKSLVAAFEYMAKVAGRRSVDPVDSPIGTIVKSAVEHKEEILDRDEPFVRLYSSRKNK